MLTTSCSNQLGVTGQLHVSEIAVSCGSLFYLLWPSRAFSLDLAHCSVVNKLISSKTASCKQFCLQRGPDG